MPGQTRTRDQRLQATPEPGNRIELLGGDGRGGWRTRRLPDLGQML